MFRFCSKAVPERGRRALRRRSGERPVALQILPPHVGYRLVRFVTLAAVTNPTSACSALRGNCAFDYNREKSGYLTVLFFLGSRKF